MKPHVRALLEARAPALLRLSRRVKYVAAAFTARRSRPLVSCYVGVTGSCGKSTATYLIGELMAASGASTRVSHRNVSIGMMRDLGGLRSRVDVFAQEISGYEPGHIAPLMPVLRPDIAVVTAIGDDHFPAFRNHLPPALENEAIPARLRRAIAQEKGNLVAGLGDGGVACLNADDPLVRTMSSRTRGRVVFFGTGTDAEVRAEHVAARWPSRLSFDLVIGGQRRHVQTRFVTTVMLTSILAALSVVHAQGGDLDAAVARLASIQPFPGRLEVVEGAHGHSFVCDTVKAPMWSVYRLIEDLPLLGGHVVFVLGEVSDSRNDKSATYRRLLRLLSENAAIAIGFGPAASNAAKVRESGYNNVFPASSQAELERLLSAQPPSLVFLKSNVQTPIRPVLLSPAEQAA